MPAAPFMSSNSEPVQTSWFSSPNWPGILGRCRHRSRLGSYETTSMPSVRSRATAMIHSPSAHTVVAPVAQFIGEGSSTRHVRVFGLYAAPAAGGFGRMPVHPPHINISRPVHTASWR